MLHDTRRTVKKIAQRLELIAPLVYRRQHPLPPFRLMYLPDDRSSAPVGPDVDVSTWEVIEPHTYWGHWFTNFVMRSEFRVPADWDANAPVALFLPLGDAGDFSHPEALAYVDGTAYAACDRHHQEIKLPDEWRDGKTRALALHGWTGLGGWRGPEPGTKLFMRPCSVVQIDQPTRELVVAAQVTLGVVEELDEDDPVRDRLLNALNDGYALTFWRRILCQCAGRI